MVMYWNEEKALLTLLIQIINKAKEELINLLARSKLETGVRGHAKI